MTGAYNREISRRKALRKRKLAKIIYHSWKDEDFEYYNNLHQYSKNKIHCDCPMCSVKTRNKGKRKRGNYHRSINYRRADLIRHISMDDQMREEGYEVPKRRVKEW